MAKYSISETGTDLNAILSFIYPTVPIDWLKSSSKEMDLIEKGANPLKDRAGKIDYERMKQPSFLMVLIATEPYAYRREDGIYVESIGCLKD